jgi:hypothetical protein
VSRWKFETYEGYEESVKYDAQYQADCRFEKNIVISNKYKMLILRCNSLANCQTGCPILRNNSHAAQSADPIHVQVSLGIATAASCVVGVGMLLSLLLFLVIIWFPQLYQPR